ncbi:hypothetical protein OG874_10040 [Nocardia sp. NBC_00565]|uniref:hypothetical protein n=1 Tax=Nocardia sp. NBC_00565 TaxID=2975993 RepID=UPI002E802EC1|nr:hypothetical protein [Nocardia sp. NBC_00565]WUC05447.1 hypothetical protein OG874_10040 [Nocardia sp. NBC_00565]
MKIKKLVATTVLTIAATGITAATAYGSPEVASETVLNGVDRGIEYTAAVAADRSDATITLASGRFVLTPDAGITVLAPDGSVVATVPTTLQTAAGQVQVTPEVDAAATTLTLTPVNAPVAQWAPLQYIGDAGTTVAGVLIGCAVGALIGLLFFIVGFLPGCVIGGIIGGIAGANQ